MFSRFSKNAEAHEYRDTRQHLSFKKHRKGCMRPVQLRCERGGPDCIACRRVPEVYNRCRSRRNDIVTSRTVIFAITLLSCLALSLHLYAQAGGDVADQIKHLQQEYRDAQMKSTPHGRSSIWRTDSSLETAAATGRRGRTS
jgi:hypothetical protein